MRKIEGRLTQARQAAAPDRLFGAGRETVQLLLEEFAAGGPNRSVAVAALEAGSPLLGVNLDTERFAASTIKIALIGAVLKCGLDLDEEIAAGDLPESKWPSILDGLDAASKLKLRDLASFALSTSDNAASELLFQRVGAAAVNEWMSAAGCSAASVMMSGYDDVAIETRGRLNLLTVSDAVIMLRAVSSDPLYLPLLRALVNNVRNQRIPRFLDDTVWAAHKTGSLNGVINDIAILLPPAGGAFILAVLTANEPDSFQAEGAIARLGERLVALAGG
jgi:beta-lactamase class A